MPSPVGHAIAGVALAWALAPRTGPSPEGTGPRAGAVAPAPAWWFVFAGVLAVAPDLDILVTIHRASWHSASAAAIVAGVVWGVGSRLALPVSAGRLAWLAGLVWLSHVGLDWLGRDTSTPQGVMLGWPFSRAYSHSGLDVFAEISRRYWKPDEIIWGNLRSVVREVAILGPPAALVWWRQRRRIRSPRL